MAGSRNWIQRHAVLSGFLLGAIAAAIASMVYVEAYGIFLTPAWGKFVFYAGFTAGGWVYANVTDSIGVSVIAGTVAVALFYGGVAAGVVWLARRGRGTGSAG